LQYCLSGPSLQSPHALGHPVEEAEIIEAEGLKGDGGAVAEADFLSWQIKPGQQVVVELFAILRIKPSPATDVIDQDQVEISAPGFYIAEQFLQGRAPPRSRARSCHHRRKS